MPRPLVSLTMIVRDEAANLPECLRSCADLFDETVVVDTGSTDETREIARSLGAKVFEFPWCDDFAAARNEALKHVSSDWVFWMDADDRLDELNRERLRRLFHNLDTNLAFSMDVVSVDLPPVWQIRLFPNRPTLRWSGRIHEELISDGLSRLAQSGIQIRHLGYVNQAEVLRKTERNMRLLKLELAERPDDPRTLFHLGGEYMLLNRPTDAWPLFSRSFELSSPAAPWRNRLLSCIALAARSLGYQREERRALEILGSVGTVESRMLLERLG